MSLSTSTSLPARKVGSQRKRDSNGNACSDINKYIPVDTAGNPLMDRENQQFGLRNLENMAQSSIGVNPRDYTSATDATSGLAMSIFIEEFVGCARRRFRYGRDCLFDICN